mgnify:CR=1 FL=1
MTYLVDFVWLRAMTEKSSKVIANDLQSIYREHGPPRILQFDQGSEFKGAVKDLCRSFKIKIIRSRPYHPQSQGKIERIHRTLRSKMEYNILKMDKEGVSWAKMLPEYQTVLNNDPKEVLGYKTPFEIYFSRKFNAKSSSPVTENHTETRSVLGSRNKELRRRCEQVGSLRLKARKASERCSERMFRTHRRQHPPSRYNIGDRVYVRLPGKSGLKSKKHQVIDAVIVN